MSRLSDAAPPPSLAAEVAEIKWWHRIDLGNGLITPGPDRSQEKLRTLGLPASLSGQTVLDIGAWDGFFSFEAERRGAARIVSMDRWDGTAGGDQRGFLLAQRTLGSRAEPVRAEVCCLADEDFARLGTFDLVLFLGVLYHVEEPLRALRNVRRLCAGRLILETEADMLWTRRPAMGFYPGRELNADPTNWFAPNASALLGMLTAAGFRDPRVHYITPWGRRLARALKHRAKFGTPILHTLQRARIVAHAQA